MDVNKPKSTTDPGAAEPEQDKSRSRLAAGRYQIVQDGQEVTEGEGGEAEDASRDAQTCVVGTFAALLHSLPTWSRRHATPSCVRRLNDDASSIALSRRAAHF